MLIFTPSVLVLSTGLILSRLVTGSLWLAIGWHTTWDFAQWSLFGISPLWRTRRRGDAGRGRPPVLHGLVEVPGQLASPPASERGGKPNRKPHKQGTGPLQSVGESSRSKTHRGRPMAIFHGFWDGPLLFGHHQGEWHPDCSSVLVAQNGNVTRRRAMRHPLQRGCHHSATIGTYRRAATPEGAPTTYESRFRSPI